MLRLTTRTPLLIPTRQKTAAAAVAKLCNVIASEETLKSGKDTAAVATQMLKLLASPMPGVNGKGYTIIVRVYLMCEKHVQGPKSSSFTESQIGYLISLPSDTNRVRVSGRGCLPKIGTSSSTAPNNNLCQTRYYGQTESVPVRMRRPDWTRPSEPILFPKLRI